MIVDIAHIYPTTIGLAHFGNCVEISQSIRALIESIPASEKTSSFNFWDYVDAESSLNEFKLKSQEIVSALDGSVESVAGEFEHARSWCVSTYGASYDQPHHHARAKWVGVYYVDVPPGCGDLLLLDPRGGVVAESSVEDGRTNRAYKRISPKTGDFIVFPGYLIHMVEPSAVMQERLVLASLFKPKQL